MISPGCGIHAKTPTFASKPELNRSPLGASWKVAMKVSRLSAYLEFPSRSRDPPLPNGVSGCDSLRAWRNFVRNRKDVDRDKKSLEEKSMEREGRIVSLLRVDSFSR